MPKGFQGPELNDLESSAERSKLNAKLSRVRAGEVPSAKIEINKRLTQKQLYPLFKIIRQTKILVYYFEKYQNTFVTKEFYAEKLNPPIISIPLDNNTDNILYDKFTINLAGYGDINS